MKIISNIELLATGSISPSSVPAGSIRLFVYDNALYSQTSNGQINRLHRV